MFFSADPGYINGLGLIKFEGFTPKELCYTKSVSEVQACVDLSLPTQAKPFVPLTDPTCPTLAILGELREQGWKPQLSKVIHNDNASRVFFF